MVAWAKEAEIPIVFTPLYYCDYRDWFERAVRRPTHWSRLARLAGRGAVWTVYRAWQTGRQPTQQVWRAMRRLLLDADTIATTSHWENEWLAAHFRLPRRARAAMSATRFGIDAALYGREFGETELTAFRRKYRIAEPYIVEVARIESKKNQLAVIEALWDDPVDLVFVGQESPYFESDYAARCRAAGERRGRTHFLGWLPKVELPLVYAASAAHILPSWNELPGLASLEAGACGANVISTKYSPMAEILGPAAFIVDPYDRASIRAASRAALRRPAPEGLRERLLREFNWREAARVNLSLYETVLAARSAAVTRSVAPRATGSA
jgi:glycosyltransferase involved in cell wall biosynthesis